MKSQYVLRFKHDLKYLTVNFKMIRSPSRYNDKPKPFHGVTGDIEKAQYWDTLGNAKSYADRFFKHILPDGYEFVRIAPVVAEVVTEDGSPVEPKNACIMKRWGYGGCQS